MTAIAVMCSPQALDFADVRFARLPKPSGPAKGGAVPDKKKLKKYVFDAGNSNTGVAGLVIAVRAYSRKGAVRIANDFLRKYQYQPLEMEGDKPDGFAGVAWALFCVGPNLRKRDIDEESVVGQALPRAGKEGD